MGIANQFTPVDLLEKSVGHARLTNRFTRTVVCNGEIPVGALVKFSDETQSSYKGNLVEVITDVAEVGLAVGIACLTQEYEAAENANGDSIYQEGDTIVIVTEGEINVYTEGAISMTDEVHARFVAGAASNRVSYSFRPDEVATETAQLTNSYWLGTSAAEGVVPLYFKAN
jgi:hypothetical protein